MAHRGLPCASVPMYELSLSAHSCLLLTIYSYPKHGELVTGSDADFLTRAIRYANFTHTHTHIQTTGLHVDAQRKA